ncbi:MAG: flavin reductase family protein [Candidatus Thorarchaeota archaeon]|nr:flavin reductase family protein [Candidatus Thorarchaeota archaeon]
MKRELKPMTAVVPCPVVLLSVGGKPRPNIITISWAANVCSSPPTVAVGIRPNRHSHGMVMEEGDFVLNIPSSTQIDASVFAGSKSGRDHDKFKECGLTPAKASKVKSPMIAECPINIECRTTQVINLGAHDLFLAEVLAVHIEESLLDEKGLLDVERTQLFTYLPLVAQYWRLGSRLTV